MKFRAFLLISLIVGCFTSAPACAEDWRQYPTRHFVIYYKDVPRSFLKTLATSAENYYSDITRDMGFTRYQGWSYERRAEIYIYDDRDDYVTNAKQKHWSHGAAFARQKIIRTFPAAHGFFDSTLPHELGHIIFREFIGYDAQVPLWLEEGVAMYQEKGKRWGAHAIVKSAIAQGHFIPLARLSRMRLYQDTKREVIDLYYAEAASVVYYMIAELGQQRFMNFCRKLKSGLSFSQSLYGAYRRFSDQDGLNRSWLNYLEVR